MQNKLYATTRRLIAQKPNCFDVVDENGNLTLLKTPDSSQKVDEGGLRLQGFYKTGDSKDPLITIITVVYNGADYLEETIKSVIEQKFDNVEYIIIDGASTDATREIIRKYEHAIDYWVSEPDKGMYDALRKGFKIASGNLMGYLNAGDIYTNTTLQSVVDFFKDTGKRWFTGMRSVCNELNYVTGVDLPFRYKTNLIRQGVYGRNLPYLQQESTFWHRNMLSYVDMDAFGDLRLAGDYYLWFCFSQHESIEVVRVQLGFFKVHDGQLSENIDKYWQEVSLFAEPIHILSYIDILIEMLFWAIHPKLRFKFKKTYIYSYEQKKWIK